MVSLAALWMPIVLSAVLVFVASSLVHMVFTYHQSDYRRLPAEDATMDALRPFKIPPGDYMMPRAAGMADMKSPAFLERIKRGPIGTLTIMPPNPSMSMAPQLVQWFVFCLVVSLFSGYIASRSLGPGAEYLRVSQIASCVAFVGYGLGQWPASIWYRRSWGTTIRGTIDALVYGFLTGGAFGWLWPTM